jgi:hypothetical protein
MSSVSLSAGPIHLGLDTSKNTIVVGILRPEEESPDVERIFNDEPSVRRLVGRFPDRGGVTRRGRPGSGSTGCCARWGWRVRWSRRR